MMSLAVLSSNPTSSSPAPQGASTCQSPHGSGCAASAAGADDQAEVLVRGARLKGAPEVTLAALLAEPAKHEGKSVRVTSKVRKACSTKGCWMELAESDKGPGVRVTFKDYGFFVPTSSAGRRAVVEGRVKVAALSEERAKHYEGEGAIVPRDGAGKPREVQLVADGVELHRK